MSVALAVGAVTFGGGADCGGPAAAETFGGGAACGGPAAAETFGGGAASGGLAAAETFGGGAASGGPAAVDLGADWSAGVLLVVGGGKGADLWKRSLVFPAGAVASSWESCVTKYLTVAVIITSTAPQTMIRSLSDFLGFCSAKGGAD